MIMQNTNINIRVSKKLKDKFVETSVSNGLNYSVVLRSLIKKYINDKGKGKEYEFIG